MLGNIEENTYDTARKMEKLFIGSKLSTSASVHSTRNNACQSQVNTCDSCISHDGIVVSEESDVEEDRSSSILSCIPLDYRQDWSSQLEKDIEECLRYHPTMDLCQLLLID